METIVRTKREVIERLRRAEDEIRALGVRRIALFGSFVRDSAGPESDVDLLVEFDPARKTFKNFMGLAFFLDDLFGRRAEVVTTESLSPYIGPRIVNESEDILHAA